MEKRKLGFWEIWNMSFGFLGIQFGFALQGGFMSRIFQTLGAEKDAIPMLISSIFFLYFNPLFSPPDQLI